MHHHLFTAKTQPKVRFSFWILLSSWQMISSWSLHLTKSIFLLSKHLHAPVSCSCNGIQKSKNFIQTSASVLVILCSCILSKSVWIHVFEPCAWFLYYCAHSSKKDRFIQSVENRCHPIPLCAGDQMYSNTIDQAQVFAWWDTNCDQPWQSALSLHSCIGKGTTNQWSSTAYT